MNQKKLILRNQLFVLCIYWLITFIHILVKAYSDCKISWKIDYQKNLVFVQIDIEGV